MIILVRRTRRHHQITGPCRHVTMDESGTSILEAGELGGDDFQQQLEHRLIAIRIEVQPAINNEIEKALSNPYQCILFC